MFDFHEGRAEAHFPLTFFRKWHVNDLHGCWKISDLVYEISHHIGERGLFKVYWKSDNADIGWVTWVDSCKKLRFRRRLFEKCEVDILDLAVPVIYSNHVNITSEQFVHMIHQFMEQRFFFMQK